jgi:Cu+-exporting ATPase
MSAPGTAAPDAPRAAPLNAQARTVIPVSGMTCAACQGRVQRALSKTPGVVDANVNLMMNSATITYDPSATGPDALVDAVRQTGYGAELPRTDASAFEEQEARDKAQDEEFRLWSLPPRSIRSTPSHTL